MVFENVLCITCSYTNVQLYTKSVTYNQGVLKIKGKLGRQQYIYADTDSHMKLLTDVISYLLYLFLLRHYVKKCVV